jgi:hypothetical protein
MAIITRCNGCGREWRERLGEVPPPNHGHTPWHLLAFPMMVLTFLVIVIALRLVS